MERKDTVVSKVETESDQGQLHNHTGIKRAAQLLNRGEVVAFPTETVYGLGGNALSDEAISQIFEAKGRPSDNPLIVHIARQDQVLEYVKEIPKNAQHLMDVFWPGPLTIVFKHSGKLSPKVTAGLSTVAIRIPDHPIALALIMESDLPLAAPSANTSGRPSPTEASHVFEDLNGRIPMILDGGKTGVGVESTVIDCTDPNGKVTILRPGGITKEALEEVVGEVFVDPALVNRDEIPISPGMKYTHYAPAAPLIMINGGIPFFKKKVEEASRSGKRVGILVTEEAKGLISPVAQEVVCGTREDLTTVANQLYHSLRKFDEGNVDIIFSEIFPETDLGAAIMNRLRKAAGGEILSEITAGK
ncbi:L-threonylcarbamoyladenylate synthase [Evansella tamaricis]|uniref:Threonylcarbamoyl-AMP synthase n=1 Tax=Evansella tamaricis TaxID=2069301 RepID=A0ABS6J9J8_9BACI|nr:L-threonylcarbamoyladenylate synthase [Evansella tamaricis]MBU9710356.1 threonylcarbamoyl-AMP synthase [Evansella tamaricis]